MNPQGPPGPHAYRPPVQNGGPPAGRRQGGLSGILASFMPGKEKAPYKNEPGMAESGYGDVPYGQQYGSPVGQQQGYVGNTGVAPPPPVYR